MLLMTADGSQRGGSPLGRESFLKKKGLTRERVLETHENSHSTRETARKLGISDRTLRRYLEMWDIPIRSGTLREGSIRERRTYWKELSKSLPDLRKYDIILVDVHGNQVPTSTIRAYVGSVNQWDFKLDVTVVLKNGWKTKIRLDLPQILEEVKNENRNETVGQVPLGPIPGPVPDPPAGMAGPGSDGYDGVPHRDDNPRTEES
jgi:hypothetical protein